MLITSDGKMTWLLCKGSLTPIMRGNVAVCQCGQNVDCSPGYVKPHWPPKDFDGDGFDMDHVEIFANVGGYFVPIALYEAVLEQVARLLNEIKVVPDAISLTPRLGPPHPTPIRHGLYGRLEAEWCFPEIYTVAGRFRAMYAGHPTHDLSILEDG